MDNNLPEMYLNIFINLSFLKVIPAKTLKILIKNINYVNIYLRETVNYLEMSHIEYYIVR